MREVEAAVLELARDYALSHGLIYRPLPSEASSPPSPSSSIHAPFALSPQPFPRHLFQLAQSLQPIYNALYAHIASDDRFLDAVVGGAVAKVDEFQGKLYDLWKTVKREGEKQPLQLGLFRSDYLLHLPEEKSQNEIELKQVEFNTISSSFGALSTKVSDLHRYLQQVNAYTEPISLDALPRNGALKGLAAGLAAAHKAYAVASAKILFVVQDNERNAFDQRALEWELLETHGISIVRLPFSTLSSHASLSPTTSALLISTPSSSTPTEISVVYYRAGYTPTDYPTPTQWDLRLLLERSLAIKCPSLSLQLAGAKKVQQVISSVDIISSFLGIGSSPSTLSPPPVSKLTPQDSVLLQNSFSGLYPLDKSLIGLEALKKAYETPEKYVLKPQREGGGNNVYRSDIPGYLDKLAQGDSEKKEGEPLEREGYILMELIEPPQGRTSTLVRAGSDPKVADVVSELGVFGVTLFMKEEGLGGGAQIWMNETVGHLLRTKGRESDEGGVAVGFSVIDSPLLV